jgi:septum formation protein
MTSSFDERDVEFEGDPVSYALKIAQGKADALKKAPSFPTEDSLLITADTIVYREGFLYHKPKDSEEAKQHLRDLSGRWHSVFSAVTVSYEDRTFSDCCETKILFSKLDENQIESYHQVINPYDKAGGYQIQGLGALVVQKIEGCYFNVLGLPLNTLLDLMKKTGFDLWQELPHMGANQAL